MTRDDESTPYRSVLQLLTEEGFDGFASAAGDSLERSDEVGTDCRAASRPLRAARPSVAVTPTALSPRPSSAAWASSAWPCRRPEASSSIP